MTSNDTPMKTAVSNRNYKNVHAPEDQAWCAFCKCYKDRSEFYRNRTTFNGLQSICKEHTKQAVNGIRERRVSV